MISFGAGITVSRASSTFEASVRQAYDGLVIIVLFQGILVFNSSVKIVHVLDDGLIHIGICQCLTKHVVR